DRFQRFALAGPVPAVEQLHVAGAVVALRDLAFERGIRQRVVLHLHRQPLLPRAQGRPLGHRPALQHAVGLEAEVVVAAAGVVQLHHEDRPLAYAGGGFATRLGRGVEATLAVVVAQAHRGAASAGLARGAARLAAARGLPGALRGGRLLRRFLRRFLRGLLRRLLRGCGRRVPVVLRGLLRRR